MSLIYGQNILPINKIIEQAAKLGKFEQNN